MKLRTKYNLHKHRNSTGHKGNIVNYSVKIVQYINAKGGKAIWRCSYCGSAVYTEAR